MVSKVNAVHAINHYLWDRLKAEAVLDPAHYGGSLVPIVPVDEDPNLSTEMEKTTGVKTHPVIVYNWYRNNVGQMWFVKSDNATFTLKATDPSKISMMINLFDQEFKDYDWAARRVNNYLRAATVPASLKAFNFKVISIFAISEQISPDVEGGLYHANVTLKLVYTE